MEEAAPTDGIRVDDRVWIPRAEVAFRATRAGGPGGQHVNTSSTRVELSWNLKDSSALDDVQRRRVLAALGKRVTADGVLRVVSSAGRSQRQNRDTAEERMAELVRGALVVRKKRVKTKPSRAAKQRRLDAKRRRGETKRERRRTED
ncbi:MAG: aminoacyl-tRNA hydrolase [Gemmatimonadota bacterium]|nr:aminoacyl-tRNA hydrolase [Gemmatimonadota bacterium]